MFSKVNKMKTLEMELQEKKGGKILMKFFEIALREVKGKLQE